MCNKSTTSSVECRIQVNTHFYETIHTHCSGFCVTSWGDKWRINNWAVLFDSLVGMRSWNIMENEDKNRKAQTPMASWGNWCYINTEFFPKWYRTFVEFSKFNEFRESVKSLTYKLGSIWGSCFLSVSYMGCVITSWSLTQEVAGSNNIFFATIFSMNSVKAFRKTQLCLVRCRQWFWAPVCQIH